MKKRCCSPDKMFNGFNILFLLILSYKWSVLSIKFPRKNLKIFRKPLMVANKVLKQKIDKVAYSSTSEMHHKSIIITTDIHEKISEPK